MLLTTILTRRSSHIKLVKLTLHIVYLGLHGFLFIAHFANGLEKMEVFVFLFDKLISKRIDIISAHITDVICECGIKEVY